MSLSPSSRIFPRTGAGEMSEEEKKPGSLRVFQSWGLLVVSVMPVPLFVELCLPSKLHQAKTGSELIYMHLGC